MTKPSFYNSQIYRPESTVELDLTKLEKVPSHITEDTNNHYKATNKNQPISNDSQNSKKMPDRGRSYIRYDGNESGRSR